MQPDQAGAMGAGTRRSPIDPGRMARAVESRRRALDRLWAAFRAGLGGPVLITGEPGAGKGWLAGRFADGLPAGWRSAEVQVGSAFDGLEWLRLVGDPIGVELPDRLGAARLRIASALGDDSADGRSWLLILDEVQRASAGVWEEIEALSDRLGRADGFAAMILLGRTELVRELATGRRRGWSGRLGLHIHLPPLDLDEARVLLDAEGRIDRAELEAIHRDARGNPRAMLRIAGASGHSLGKPTGPALPRRARPIPAVEESRPIAPASIADDPTAPRLPSLIPTRPPIRLEDGLVEVGWEGDMEAEPTRPERDPADHDASPTAADRDEELVEDRYAALQAWAEWSRNRGRSAPVAADETEAPEVVEVEPPPTATVDADDPGRADAPTVRAEPPQDFAPYSPLFGRLRHSL